MTNASINPEIRAAAQKWFVRLQSPECSEAERENFARWRAAGPAHEAAYRTVESIWQRSAAIGHDAALADVLQAARRLPAQQSLFRRVWPAVAVAASLMLAVGIGYRLYMTPEDLVTQHYATVLGEQSTITLEDGSIVVLDTQSALQVEYGKRERRLVLQQGQADFQVQHDTERPFVVHISGASITATGTQFQVHVADDGPGSVTLLKGQVIVASQVAGASANAKATLAPDERIAIHADGTLGAPQRLVEQDLATARGWTEGSLVVREWPLEKLVAEMNRYTDTPLRLGDASLGNLQISGNFKPADRESFLLSLEYGWPIRIDRSHQGDIVLRRR